MIVGFTAYSKLFPTDIPGYSKQALVPVVLRMISCREKGYVFWETKQAIKF